MVQERAGKVRFASYLFDRATGELTREGIRLRLERQPACVLNLLIAAEGDLVTREQLVAALWPDEVSGEFDRRLDKALAKLRAALNDSPHSPVFVETLKGRGYRFIATVFPEPPVSEAPSPAAAGSGAGQESPAAAADPAPEPEPDAAGVEQPEPVSARVGLAELAGIFFHGAFGILGLCLIALVVAGIVEASSRLYTDPPFVAGFTQLTHDSLRKDLVGVDGKRFYVVEASSLQTIKAISFADGSVSEIPVVVPLPVILDLARDGSAFLVASTKTGSSGLWKLHLPEGSLTCLVPQMPVTAAAFSPDGKTVLFANTSGQFFAVASDGAGMHALRAPAIPTESWRIEDLRWSPDGASLRFTRRHALWEMKPDGADLHPVIPTWNSGRWSCCGQWSADGRLYVLSARDSLYSSTLLSDRLWAFDLRGPIERFLRASPIQLTSGPMRWSSAIPSRDGSVLYARGILLRGELVRAVPRTAVLEPLLGGISAEYLAYSPDGQFICYVSFPEGTMWKARRDGSHAMQLTGEPFYPIAPHWSPDGSTIAFDSTDATGITSTWAIPSAGGKPYRLIPEESASQGDAVWSPDGRRMAYSTRPDRLSGRLAGMRFYDLATHAIADVPGSEYLWSPRWSPDGRFLVAIDDRTRGLKRFDVAAQKWTPIEDGQAEFPNFSRDGRWVYFLHPFEAPGVYRVPLTGGPVERVLDLANVPLTGYYSFWLGLDDEGSPVLLRDAGIDEIYALRMQSP